MEAEKMDINAFWHDVLSKKREALRDYITAQRLIDVQSYAWIHRRAFDLLNSDDTYSIHFRLVRIKLDDSNYECLVTNLPRDRFSMKKLKKLYHLRFNSFICCSLFFFDVGRNVC